MSKAVLIMDMPECCYVCPLTQCEADNMSTEHRSENCPLREMPEKMEICGKYMQPDSSEEIKKGKPKSHKIKTLTQYFQKSITREKRFEIRKDDRKYQVGDWVTLEEWSPKSGYTGNWIEVHITYVLRNCPEYGLKEGYCILGW